MVVNQVDQAIVLPRLSLPIEMPDGTILRPVLHRLRCVVDPCEQETASEAPSRRTAVCDSQRSGQWTPVALGGQPSTCSVPGSCPASTIPAGPDPSLPGRVVWS